MLENIIWQFIYQTAAKNRKRIELDDSAVFSAGMLFPKVWMKQMT
jgi:hypothetical protein